jgi:hypothetical protein
VVLGPAEVHPQKHLRPVGRLGPACAGADRQDGRARIVGTREEELAAGRAELGFERGGLPGELGLQLRIATGLVDQLDEGEQLLGAIQKAAPQADLGAQPVGLAEDALGGLLIVPEAGLLGQCLELGDAGVLAVEVKVAPRSPGSARPGRE